MVRGVVLIDLSGCGHSGRTEGACFGLLHPNPRLKVPAGPDWVHEIKHDGCRLQVRKDGNTVRLFTPLITETLLATADEVIQWCDGESSSQDLEAR